MIIQSITAKNYRTLQDLHLPFAGNYCTISGKNNAGKSAVIRLLSSMFRGSLGLPWEPAPRGLDYQEDRTQWVKRGEPISITYRFLLSRNDDPALIAFIEKISRIESSGTEIPLSVTHCVSEGEHPVVTASFADRETGEQSAKEIDKRIKDSNLLFLYNSTTRHDELYYGRGRPRQIYEFVMSDEEKRQLDKAARHVERQIRRLAREHREGLREILGRLSERYDVEFSSPEGFAARHMPLGINLHDRNVEVPLGDWGSGTQNRTRILMAIIQANRVKTSESPDERITPIVIIEEPESFLHPAAQSEFGRILKGLSSQFGIQIVATTHSPYMLNQEDSSANLLLARRCRHGKRYETALVDTSGEEWMAPFAEHLGIAPKEFLSWRPVFSTYRSKVLLVEGPLDKEYFEHLKTALPPGDALDQDIEIVPYGGKDTLKNTLLVQFVLKKFDQVFVTYDLDADAEIRPSLGRLGLRERSDFAPLGVQQAGRNCIEGILPRQVLEEVIGRDTDLVMKLSASDGSERRRAKEEFKRRCLDEFKRHRAFAKDEIKEFVKVIGAINARLGSNGVPGKASRQGRKARTKARPERR